MMMLSCVKVIVEKSIPIMFKECISHWLAIKYAIEKEAKKQLDE
jgi:hypothetical protein